MLFPSFCCTHSDSCSHVRAKECKLGHFHLQHEPFRWYCSEMHRTKVKFVMEFAVCWKCAHILNYNAAQYQKCQKLHRQAARPSMCWSALLCILVTLQCLLSLLQITPQRVLEAQQSIKDLNTWWVLKSAQNQTLVQPCHLKVIVLLPLYL